VGLAQLFSDRVFEGAERDISVAVTQWGRNGGASGLGPPSLWQRFRFQAGVGGEPDEADCPVVK